MTDEEFERRMGFIIEQQARLVVNQEKADERITKLENVVDRVVGVVDRLATVTFERFDQLEEKMSTLADSQIKLSEAQARTDERLNALINMVERYLSRGSNGPS